MLMPTFHTDIHRQDFVALVMALYSKNDTDIPEIGKKNEKYYLVHGNFIRYDAILHLEVPENASGKRRQGETK